MTTILDPIIHPYFITKDQHCYAVNEIIEKTNEHHFSNKKVHKQNSKKIGYYTDFSTALTSIALLKVGTEKSEYTIQEFIEEWRVIKKKIYKLTKLQDL